MIGPEECHGRVTFAGRPAAGMNPWEWWWSTFEPQVPIYAGVPGGEKDPLLWATTRWTDRGPLVTLHYKLTPIQKRLAVAHEMHHLAIGGVCQRRCRKNEAKVVRATVRWLLPDVEDLATRLTRQSLGSAARDLLVNSGTVWDRLKCTTPRERRVIDEIMSAGPSWRSDARAALPTLAAAS